ncbi:30S ribosomal protein S20 [bacterium]|nr:30S ribosomal protein S20 [bacterium]
MPNKVSARKRVRQNEARRVRNRATRSDMRSAVKSAQAAVAEKKVELLPAVLSEAQSKLAKAAKRNIIKKNKLARQTSRLMKAANKAKQA